MSTYLPVPLRRQLEEADDHACVYCQTTQANSGQLMTVEHIQPESKGGKTEFTNLCFACRQCNEYKGSVTELEDPLTRKLTPLFHPRRQIWAEHFAWDVSSTRLMGLTAVGRVTIIALKMNQPVIIESRRRWVSAGWHPPSR